MRLGIDIGGTKTAAAAIWPDGVVAAVQSRPSGRGPQGVVEIALQVVGEVVAEIGGLAGVGFVGACMPGLVDPGAGTVRHAVNLGVESLDLAGQLGRVLQREVTIENDVKAAALGASHLLAGQGPAPRRGRIATLAYLNLGTGLASAIVHDGVVVRGIGGVAGEIGHLPFGGDVVCSCGQVGCLETLASGSALARMWPPSARAVADPFEAARSGDSVAARAVEELCRGVGVAVQLLVLAAGAQHVVIGGGLAALGEPLANGIRLDLERRARSSRVLASLHLPTRFELLPSTVPVAAIGAAWLGDGRGEGDPVGGELPTGAPALVHAPEGHRAG